MQVCLTGIDRGEALRHLGWCGRAVPPETAEALLLTRARPPGGLALLSAAA